MILFAQAPTTGPGQSNGSFNTIQPDNNGKGKGHHPPVTPEPAVYGAIFVALCLGLLWVVRMRRRSA